MPKDWDRHDSFGREVYPMMGFSCLFCYCNLQHCMKSSFVATPNLSQSDALDITDLTLSRSDPSEQILPTDAIDQSYAPRAPYIHNALLCSLRISRVFHIWGRTFVSITRAR
mmetsp:Transcript_33705/g.77772  ORF Transcript_33705/g.77772 Transcript_33705/m.77772 type:complete len:112 (-) Transcript_33705:783-1118(-)